jgi:hypothetical protein
MTDSLATPSRHTAPVSERDTPERRTPGSRVRRGGLVLVIALVGMFAALNIHELGHTIAAWLAGDHHASYQLHCGSEGFGCNHFSAAGMNIFEKAMVTLGGPLITQIFTWSLFVLRRRAGRRWRLILTPLVAVFAVDLFLQFAQAAFTPLPVYDLTNVDFTALATLLGWSQPFSLAVFIGGALAYVALWVRLGYRARS